MKREHEKNRAFKKYILKNRFKTDLQHRKILIPPLKWTRDNNAYAIIVSLYGCFSHCLMLLATSGFLFLFKERQNIQHGVLLCFLNGAPGGSVQLTNQGNYSIEMGSVKSRWPVL